MGTESKVFYVNMLKLYHDPSNQGDANSTVLFTEDTEDEKNDIQLHMLDTEEKINAIHVQEKLICEPCNQIRELLNEN